VVTRRPGFSGGVFYRAYLRRTNVLLPTQSDRETERFRYRLLFAAQPDVVWASRGRSSPSRLLRIYFFAASASFARHETNIVKVLAALATSAVFSSF
jgi:hypothetical protein